MRWVGIANWAEPMKFGLGWAISTQQIFFFLGSGPDPAQPYRLGHIRSDPPFGVNYCSIACKIYSACNGHENRGRNEGRREGGHLTQVGGTAGLGG